MNRIVFALIILVIFSCEVEFNSNLQDYIDNVSERTPLNLSVDRSIGIGNEVSFNYGFTIDNVTETIVFRNNELHSVTINSHSGLTGDFTMDPLDSVKLEPGETLELNITYIPGYTPGETVESYLTLKDRRDREFKLKLYGSSRRQPLDIRVEGTPVKSFDFGNFSGSENSVVFELYNDGAVELTIESLTLPVNIERVGGGLPSLGIGGSAEIELFFNGGGEIWDENLVITTDFNQISTRELSVRAGEYLPVDIDEVDSNNNFIDSVVGDIIFNDSVNRVKYFELVNNTEFTMSVYSIIQPDDYYLADFISTELEPGDSMNFSLSYEPGLLTPSDTYSSLIIIDVVSRRERWIGLNIGF